MKLKYYLRGLGLGVVLTAILMGVTLGRNNSKMTDEEIIRRAKQLGMVEAESTLSSYSETAKSSEVTDEANNSASDTQVDEKREEVSEEVNETESSAAESVSEMDEASKKSEEMGESSESIESEEDVKLASDDAAEPAQESAPAAVNTDNGDTSYIVVVLPSGSDSDDCARILREAGVISDGVEYNNYLISTGKDRLIRSGTKQIPRGASFEEITSIITR